MKDIVADEADVPPLHWRQKGHSKKGGAPRSPPSFSSLSHLFCCLVCSTLISVYFSQSNGERSPLRMVRPAGFDVLSLSFSLTVFCRFFSKLITDPPRARCSIFLLVLLACSGPVAGLHSEVDANKCRSAAEVIEFSQFLKATTCWSTQ